MVVEGRLITLDGGLSGMKVPPALALVPQRGNSDSSHGFGFTHHALDNHSPAI